MGFWKNLKETLLRPSAPPPGVSLGRNDPCWCGSGKKYKYCHYEKDQAGISRRRAAARTCKVKG